MDYIYRAENCKNNFKIVGQIIFKKKNDMAADVAQYESSSIKRYVSAFSNILITRIFIHFFTYMYFQKKIKNMCLNTHTKWPESLLEKLWILSCVFHWYSRVQTLLSFWLFALLWWTIASYRRHKSDGVNDQTKTLILKKKIVILKKKKKKSFDVGSTWERKISHDLGAWDLPLTG